MVASIIINLDGTDSEHPIKSVTGFKPNTAEVVQTFNLSAEGFPSGLGVAQAPPAVPAGRMWDHPGAWSVSVPLEAFEQLFGPTGFEMAPQQVITPTGNTCAYCKKKFIRTQELKRHQRDVHKPRHKCPFCTFSWTRPVKIQHHIESSHGDNFTAELLGEFRALRGNQIVEFLNECWAWKNPEYRLDLPDFPYLPALM